MDIKATKAWWEGICMAGGMTPDEAATLVHTVDDLIAEVERLASLNTNLLNGEVPVCGDCDGTGWKENRVDGRYACTCMTEAEPYQFLELQCNSLKIILEKIRRIATGEDQVADDDAEGMGSIAQIVAGAFDTYGGPACVVCGLAPCDCAAREAQPQVKECTRWTCGIHPDNPCPPDCDGSLDTQHKNSV